MHLFHRKRALRVSLEEWVIHATNSGVRFEELRYPQCVLILPMDTHCKRLDAAQQQPGGVRVHVAPERGARCVDRLHKVPPAGNDSADNIRVPAEVLGAGMHDEVDAVFGGAAIDGR